MVTTPIHFRGGAVPGNVLRVVDIAGIDQEACCGTHCDNTSQVGLIKIISTSRISDGTVRLTYVAGDLALEQVAQQTRILNSLQNEWKVTRRDVVSTADRFFDGYKKFGAKVKKQSVQIDQLALSYFLLDEKRQKLLISSDEATATQYISVLPQFAQVRKK
jgi:alanyl-tRNA synthetase